MMKRAFIFLFAAVLSVVSFEGRAKSYQSFLVRVEDDKISVTSPKKPRKLVTVVVKNETFDKIISEIKTNKKTLKRFVLEPSGSKGAQYTLTVDVSKTDGLYYVSVAPPFQEVPLRFSKETYEVP